ncbi:chemotaxis protein CheX [bacterium]|nr:chemotaxis protein CheX [bacterium]
MPVDIFLLKLQTEAQIEDECQKIIGGIINEKILLQDAVNTEFDFTKSITGCINLIGDINLLISISFPFALGKDLSARTLELSLQDVDAELMIDNVQEILNQVGGGVKNFIVLQNVKIDMELPRVKLGRDYVKTASPKKRNFYKIENQIFCVDVTID